MVELVTLHMGRKGDKTEAPPVLLQLYGRCVVGLHAIPLLTWDVGGEPAICVVVVSYPKKRKNPFPSFQGQKPHGRGGWITHTYLTLVHLLPSGIRSLLFLVLLPPNPPSSISPLLLDTNTICVYAFPSPCCKHHPVRHPFPPFRPPTLYLRRHRLIQFRRANPPVAT